MNTWAIAAIIERTITLEIAATNHSFFDGNDFVLQAIFCCWMRLFYFG